jgi:hypothetical protein
MAGTLVANTINTDTGLFSTQNAYQGIAKAWVNFTGSTAVIRSSFNVSSITRTGTGDYTLNFTTAMPDANYCVAGSGETTSGSTNIHILTVRTFTTTSLRVGIFNTTGLEDSSIVSVLVVGN